MIDKGLSYAYPLRFEKGGAVPDWVDPNYGYDPNNPRKPNMREMMEYMSGRTIDELYADPNSNWQDLSKQASSILYGVVGSNTESRDFNQIMDKGSKGDPQSIVNAAGVETRAMYSRQNRSQQELDKIKQAYANLAINPLTENLAQVISFDSGVPEGRSQLYFTDNQGALLTVADSNTAASFGFTQEELDQARGQMIGGSSLAQYYASAPRAPSAVAPVAPTAASPFSPSAVAPVAPVSDLFPEQPVFNTPPTVATTAPVGNFFPEQPVFNPAPVGNFFPEQPVFNPPPVVMPDQTYTPSVFVRPSDGLTSVPDQTYTSTYTPPVFVRPSDGIMGLQLDNLKLS